MSRYRVFEEERQGVRVIHLHDQDTGAGAAIAPELGANLLELRLPTPQGRAIPVITPPADPTVLRQSPSRWGNPILFPWPGRIPGGEYRWQGEVRRLALDDPAGNAVHGLVKDQPWDVAEALACESAAQVRCRISAERLSSVARDGYPYEWVLELTFRLSPEGLTCSATVTNTGAQPMPFGLGLHPYFTIPFGSSGAAEDCLLSVPASHVWNLDVLKSVWEAPAGARPVKRPLTREESLKAPVPLRGRTLNAVLTNLEMENATAQETRCTLTDPAAGLTLHVGSLNFSNIVLWEPPDRPEICIEPWTCPPNAFNAADAGVPETGLIVLPPSAVWRGGLSLSLT